MKKAILPFLLMGLLACTPKPPIYIITKSPASTLQSIKTSRFELGPVGQVDLHDFKRAFVKKYETTEAFVKKFHDSLTIQLTDGAAQNGSLYFIELPNLDVDSHTESFTMMVGGGPNMPARMQTTNTEYCVIKLSYRVRNAEGIAFLEGQVVEKTAKGEFLHPNQSKLENAVQGVQKHLVDYLRGRMPGENVQAPPPPTTAS